MARQKSGEAPRVPAAPRKRGAGGRKGAGGKRGPPGEGAAARRNGAPRPRGRTWLAARHPRTWKGVLLAWGLGIVGGALAACVVVVSLLAHHAQLRVRDALDHPVWGPTGRVMSAPLEVWPGLALTPEALAEDLQAAGYARASKVEQPGDFVVRGQDVLVHVPPFESPTGGSKGGEVLVTFAKGKVKSTSPARRGRFAPVELAALSKKGEARRPVPLGDMPDDLVDAVLAMEDARFWEHEGVDLLGVGRAVVVNLLAGETRQGGSTLTQQLAKNLFLDQERTLQRKGREAVLAVAMERELSKEQILELYLNAIYLGQAGGTGVWGMDQAARTYFGKPVGRLDLAESATLAGIISGPNLYSPLRHPERARERRDVVLDRMVEVGFTEASRATAAKGRDLVLHPTLQEKRAPWAVDAAIERGEEILGLAIADGAVVHTTIQPALQRLGERVVTDSLAELRKAYPKLQSAEMALAAVRVRDGAILALVGSHDYASSPFDRASHAERQVGSTIKPLTMLAAFEDRPDLGPATLVRDEPITRTHDGKSWTPTNYDGAFLGEVPLLRVLTQSRNVPSVLLAEEVGLQRLAPFWKRLGLDRATAFPSSALGAFEATPVELAAAYTVFPGQGVVARPWLVAGTAAPKGDLRAQKPPAGESVVSSRAAWLVTALLQENLRSGTGAKARSFGVDGSAGGKTGTTDDARDAWFVGFSPEIAVAVWVGFDKGKVLGLTGSQAALPAWSRFMAGSGTLGGAFVVPANVERCDLCTATWEPNDETCLSGTVEAWFTQGELPWGACRRPEPVADLRGPARLLHQLGWRSGSELPEPRVLEGQGTDVARPVAEAQEDDAATEPAEPRLLPRILRNLR